MSPAAPRLLVVAGRDSRGLAGVDADLETARALGARARIVVTAETIQGRGGLVELGARPPERWLAEALGETLGEAESFPDAIKFGLLPGVEPARAARELVQCLRERALARTHTSSVARPALPVVIDPVLAPSAGGEFHRAEERAALAAALLPAGLVWTPNVPELAALTARDPERLARDEELRGRAVSELLSRGAAGVVQTGGHAEGEAVVDLVQVAGEELARIRHRRLARRLSGTGCRHATALAIGLARGDSLTAAARAAALHVAACLESRGVPL